MLQDVFFDELANMVIFYRKKSGLNRIELARMAGVGKTVIYDIENAKQTVRLDTIIKILNVLNIKIKLIGPIATYKEMQNEKG